MKGDGNRQNLYGKKLGKLTAVKPTNKKMSESIIWEFMCDCGNIVYLSVGQVNRNKNKMCKECYDKERSKISEKHGESKTRLYKIHQGIQQRCNNPLSTGYENYGGRNIKICEEWIDFMEFKKWSYLNGYCDGLQIDRIDNDGNYEPNNCRWVNSKINNSSWEKRKLVSTNKTGFNGVWESKGKFHAQLGYNGKRYSSKAFDTALEAAKERIRLEIKHTGEQRTNLHLELKESDHESVITIKLSEYIKLIEFYNKNNTEVKL